MLYFSTAHQEAAEAEGWAITQGDGSDRGPVQLKRIHNAGRFPSDEAAWVHVVRLAAANAPHAVAALLHLATVNLPELMRVMVAAPTVNGEAAVAAVAAYREKRPTPDPMLRWFRHDHLPPRLRATSEAFARTAAWVSDNVTPGPEREAAFRKLLEAKDAAVRATLEWGD
jgi:hypothetical protein